MNLYINVNQLRTQHFYFTRKMRKREYKDWKKVKRFEKFLQFIKIH